MKEAYWKHKNYGKRKYKGYYTLVSGERVFVLVSYIKGQRAHHVTCESHQMAKKSWMD